MSLTKFVAQSAGLVWQETMILWSFVRSTVLSVERDYCISWGCKMKILLAVIIGALLVRKHGIIEMALVALVAYMVISLFV